MKLSVMRELPVGTKLYYVNLKTGDSPYVAEAFVREPGRYRRDGSKTHGDDHSVGTEGSLAQHVAYKNPDGKVYGADCRFCYASKNEANAALSAHLEARIAKLKAALAKIA